MLFNQHNWCGRDSFINDDFKIIEKSIFNYSEYSVRISWFEHWTINPSIQLKYNLVVYKI